MQQVSMPRVLTSGMSSADCVALTEARFPEHTGEAIGGDDTGGGCHAGGDADVDGGGQRGNVGGGFDDFDDDDDDDNNDNNDDGDDDDGGDESDDSDDYGLGR
jgi:hypothetical protein